MNDLNQLKKVRNILSDLDYETSLLSESETGSMDMILLKFQNNINQPQSLAISFLPLNDELEGSLFMQFYYEFPFLIQSPCPNELKTLIQNVNRQLPLGHFNTNIAWNQIYFKYVLAISGKNFADEDQIADILDMILFAIPHFENEFSAFKKD